MNVINREKLITELGFKASRSGGSGGQNVNKVSTKMELNFNVAESLELSEEQKQLVFLKLHNHITKEGILRVVSQTERSQLGNKEVAIRKFFLLLTKAFHTPKSRKATRPSKSSKEKRIINKKKHSEIKQSRRKDF